jgi:hypothetical protein
LSGRDFVLQAVYVALALGAVFGVRELFVRRQKPKKPKKKTRAKAKK